MSGDLTLTPTFTRTKKVLFLLLTTTELSAGMPKRVSTRFTSRSGLIGITAK